MTNREAITILANRAVDLKIIMSNEDLLTDVYGEEETKKELQALDLAIKALEERPQGEWIFDADFLMVGSPYGSYKCSECGMYTDDGEDNFCWFCGADMRGDKRMKMKIRVNHS